MPHFWDPFRVKTVPGGTEYCAMAIMVLMAETSGITMLLPAYGSSVNGPVVVSPDPIADGNDGRLGNGKSSASVTVNFRTASVQNTPVNGYFWGWPLVNRPVAQVSRSIYGWSAMAIGMVVMCMILGSLRTSAVAKESGTDGSLGLRSSIHF